MPSSSSASKRPTVEETYEKLVEAEHVLKRPDTFVGSCVNNPQVMPTFSFEKGLEVKEVACVEGLRGIFDEVVVNAADHKTRNPKEMTYLNVVFKDNGATVVVKNNGPGIPVEIHKKYNEWVPEMLFGSFRTSSNFNDQGVKRQTGGRNGFGAKLTNVFSKRFKVTTTDAVNKKRFSMTWTNSMAKKSSPKIVDLANVENPVPCTTIEFEPDMSYFDGVESLTEVRGILAKRLLDIAGTCSSLTVKLDGQKMPVRGFKEYCTYVAKAMGVTSEVVYVRPNDRWEIAMCASPTEEPVDVSFVNRICTSSGGTHMRMVRRAIENELQARLEKTLKAKVAVSKVRNNLCIFVNALIDNPAFGSQTKVELTSRSSTFGSTHGLEAKHFTKLFKQSDIMSIVEERAKGQLGNKVPTTTKSRTVREEKLRDANWAGTKRSSLCRLILTEGDSAATLAISGREKAGGPDVNGVYPLRGKMFNPCKGLKDSKFSVISTDKKKKAFNTIVRALNLKNDVDYTLESERKTLRYGKLVIMADQDKDGAHIAGLLMNFLKWWNPTILKVPGFLMQFVTPIMKATYKKEVLPFFSDAEYTAWSQRADVDVQKYEIKYYKGLGTSTAAEAKVYFSDLPTHLLEFEVLDQAASDMMDVAFSGRKQAERKRWITDSMRTALPSPEYTAELQRYDRFLNSSLMEYNIASITRSIPSMVDGLKEVQRKVLHACLKRNLVRETKVPTVASMVGEVALYHHGEASMMDTLLGMAQTFVGKNNINLLFPSGQFGTRLQGGKDAAAPRYIFTRLSSVTRKLFPEMDDCILEYLTEEGMEIEPRTFLPILPMVLVNGAHGIATGWSTDLCMHDPAALARYILNQLRNQDTKVKLEPWYRGFTGRVEDVGAAEGTGEEGVEFRTVGKYEFGKNHKVRITDLPVGTWTEKYIEKMLDMKETDSKTAQNIVVKHRDNSSDLRVDVVFTLLPHVYEKFSTDHAAFEKKFELVSYMNMKNVHLLDPNGRLKKYRNAEHVMDEFIPFRLGKYQLRKAKMLEALVEKAEELPQKMRFIMGVVDQTVRVRNVAKSTTVQDMVQLGIMEKYHDKFLKMSISSLNTERVQALREEVAKVALQKQELEATAPAKMWTDDLEEFLKCWNATMEAEKTARTESKKVACSPVKRKRKAKFSSSNSSSSSSSNTGGATKSCKMEEDAN